VGWWTEFWTWVNENQLAATVIGTLLATGLVWLLSRLPKVGPHVRTALKWLWSWHPVSAHRHTRDLAAVSEASSAYAQKRTEGIAEKVKTSHEDGLKIDTDANVRAIPAPPPPEPRWKLVRMSGAEDVKCRFTISNLVPGSVALNVRMDNLGQGMFSFDDAAFWPDLSGESSGDFSGVIRSTNAVNRIHLKLTWLNHKHDGQSHTFVVDGPSAWDPIPDAWRTAPHLPDAPF